MKKRLEKYSERFDNDKSPIGNPDTWGKRIVEEPKQEKDYSALLQPVGTKQELERGITITNVSKQEKFKKNRKEILLAWQGYCEKSTGTFVDLEERTVVYLDTEPIWAKMQKDIEAYKNRIKVLQNLNFKYREKLGISNEPIDAINAVNECNHENIQMKSSGIWKCKCGYTHY